MPIFIVGYMASGKTTFGKALANKLNSTFIDLDQYIENGQGLTVSEIFHLKGEEGFREIERNALKELADTSPNTVIACGGGTPCFFDNMQLLNDSGITIFLETSTPVLIDRLIAENSDRPLVAGLTESEIEKKVLSQLCQRLPYYMEAKLKWHGDDLENETEIQENVDSFVSSYPSLFRP